MVVGTGTGPADLESVAALLENADPTTTVQWAHEQFGDDLALATGFGPEGVVLIDMFCRLAPNPRIFYLDTGFLFPQTHGLRDRLSLRYGIEFEPVLSSTSIEEQEELHGPNLWSRDPDSCCSIRKVRPLAGYLSRLKAWMASIRRDQTAQRAHVRSVEWDAKFGLVKINPLASWTAGEVWAYIRGNDLPCNELHTVGYPSIGCTHCTRPVKAGESERDGRWSWTDKTECGLHA